MRITLVIILFPPKIFAAEILLKTFDRKLGLRNYAAEMDAVSSECSENCRCTALLRTWNPETVWISSRTAVYGLSKLLDARYCGNTGGFRRGVAARGTLHTPCCFHHGRRNGVRLFQGALAPQLLSHPEYGRDHGHALLRLSIFICRRRRAMEPGPTPSGKETEKEIITSRPRARESSRSLFGGSPDERTGV